MTIKKGSFIYKLFVTYKSLEEMDDLQWFALEKGYGSYGDIQRKYKFKKKPKLLDIGDGSVREMIEDEIANNPLNENNVDKKNILFYGDPNEQYSGGKSNKIYHTLVQKYFGDEYDGTIIDETNLYGSSKYLAEDLEGPSEIVIWKNHGDLLVELNDDLDRQINKKKKKTKTKKTNKKKKKTKTIKSKK
jgi:hypothetical protein